MYENKNNQKFSKIVMINLITENDSYQMFGVIFYHNTIPVEVTWYNNLNFVNITFWNVLWQWIFTIIVSLAVIPISSCLSPVIENSSLIALSYYVAMVLL